jgi:CarD family transcriptional regulator
MVPTDNADAVGLREIISDKEVQNVYKILKKRDVKIDQTTWNRRYREYMEKIKTGSVYEIAEVLRNLFMLRHSKDLSFGERKMLDQAKALLVKEISLARGQKEEIIEQEIQTIFAS